MKQNNLHAILMGILVVIVLLTGWYTFSYNKSLRTFRQLQPKAAFYNNKTLMMQALAKDVLEYSSRNPAVNPLLQSVGLKTANTPVPPAARPAGK